MEFQTTIVPSAKKTFVQNVVVRRAMKNTLELAQRAEEKMVRKDGQTAQSFFSLLARMESVWVVI